MRAGWCTLGGVLYLCACLHAVCLFACCVLRARCCALIGACWALGCDQLGASGTGADLRPAPTDCPVLRSVPDRLRHRPRGLHGNFDIVLDHFSRISQLCTIPHAAMYSTSCHAIFRFLSFFFLFLSFSLSFPLFLSFYLFLFLSLFLVFFSFSLFGADWGLILFR